MRIIENNGIKLATESFGTPHDPPILLIMGATASMLGWPDDFCAALARAGLFVIRYDHRDTGLSTTLPPNTAGYTVEDLADDALAVLDGYGYARAHIAGMSLGGYIGQMLAVAHPERLLSLTLIASEPLGWDGPPLPHISDAFLAHFGTLADMDWEDRDAVRAFLFQSERLCAGPRAPFDEDRARSDVDRVLARSPHIASMFNHGSMGVAGDWDGAFRRIACSVLVVHGTEDPILPPANGKALAEGILDATFVSLDKVGHDIPAAIIAALAQVIAAHTGCGQTEGVQSLHLLDRVEDGSFRL